MENRIKEDLQLDTSFVSEENCPNEGQNFGDHYFRKLEVNCPCNCSLFIMIKINLPKIYIKHITGMIYIIDISQVIL